MSDLTEEEHAAMCKMVDELDELSTSNKRGRHAAWFKLDMLARTTGDEWVSLVRRFLADRAADQTSGS